MNVGLCDVNTASVNFKSVYPVYHWLSDNGSKYGVVTTEKLTKKLQSKLVRDLNHRRTGLNAVSEKIKAKDLSYKKMELSRSYYNRNGGFKNSGFEPIAFLITGEDVELFESLFGKPIGHTKKNSKFANKKIKSAELILAQEDYKTYGLSWVKNLANRFKDENGVLFGLHTKFKTIRNKKGQIKDFKLQDIKFCPESGKENPFVKCGYYK